MVYNWKFVGKETQGSMFGYKKFENEDDASSTDENTNDLQYLICDPSVVPKKLSEHCIASRKIYARFSGSNSRLDSVDTFRQSAQIVPSAYHLFVDLAYLDAKNCAYEVPNNNTRIPRHDFGRETNRKVVSFPTSNTRQKTVFKLNLLKSTINPKRKLSVRISEGYDNFAYFDAEHHLSPGTSKTSQGNGDGLDKSEKFEKLEPHEDEPLIKFDSVDRRNYPLHSPLSRIQQYTNAKCNDDYGKKYEREKTFSNSFNKQDFDDSIAVSKQNIFIKTGTIHDSNASNINSSDELYKTTSQKFNVQPCSRSQVQIENAHSSFKGSNFIDINTDRGRANQNITEGGIVRSRVLDVIVATPSTSDVTENFDTTPYSGNDILYKHTAANDVFENMLKTPKRNSATKFIRRFSSRIFKPTKHSSSSNHRSATVFQTFGKEVSNFARLCFPAELRKKLSLLK